MSSEQHRRAQRLIAQERIEGAESIAAAERDWLMQHLRECEECSQAARSTERALASLRSLGVDVPPGLASRTQLRVRLRAEELREHAPARKYLWAISGVSWALGVATAPWVWQAFSWLGQHAGVPKLVWQLGFVLWWAVPAMFAAGAVIVEKTGLARESD